MRYLCLFYIDQNLADAASKEEWAEIDRESLASNEELKRSGHYLASNALADPKTAKTLRVRAGKASWTDRPFAETKEHLGGFLLIEAKNLAEAMEIAERDSLARMGAIEVRETAGFLASKCPGYFHQPQTSASVTPIGGRNGRFGSCALVGPECPVSESKIGPGRSGQGQRTNPLAGGARGLRRELRWQHR